MATIGTERYSRINLILADGGTKLTRRMFLKRVHELSNPDQDDIINTFLANNKRSLLKTQTGRNRERTLYPPSGCTTNLDRWDLYLLCFILQEVCHLNYINQKDIEKLQRMRNDLCHLSNPTLDEISFRTQLEEIKIMFKRSLQIVGDPDFEIELNQLVDKYEHGPISVDDIVRLHHHYSKLELERNERFDDFIDSQKESNARIEQRIDTLMSRFDGLARFLPEDTVVEVPGATMILEVNNCPEERESSILRLLVKLFEEKILNTELLLSEDLSELATQELREAVAKLFNEFKAKGRHIVKVEQKCLLLEVQCDTIAAYVELVNDVRNHRLVNEFQDTVQAIKSLDGYAHVIFNIEISRDEIIRVFDELVTVLEKTVFTVMPVKSKDEPEKEQSTFNIQQPDENDYYSTNTGAKTSLTAESQCKTESKRKEQDIPEEVVKSTDCKIPELQTENKQKEQKDTGIPEEVVTSTDSKVPEQVDGRFLQRCGFKETMGEKLLVAAIDFGTTYSGYAFSFRHEYERDPLKISTNTAWNIGDQGMLSWKTPTTVLLKPDQSFHAFGFDAEDKYCELAEEHEHHEWYYFRRFKMLLHNKLTLKRDTMIEDSMGKEMPARTIFTIALRYITQHFLKLINTKGLEITQDDIRWVLTVPAIWDEPAKQFMREVAVDAGIPSKQLWLALEPEAASVYCKLVPLERHEGKGGEFAMPGPFRPETRYMVLDIGGGTVDVTVHEVKQDGSLKELQKASGGAWGGTKVDASYFELFSNIFGTELMKDFKWEEKYEHLEMERVFEIKKRSVKSESERITFKVSALFNKLVQEKTGLTSQMMVDKAGFTDKIAFKRDRMTFKAEVMRELFEPSIKSIIDHVKEMLKHPKVQRLDKILMVGGFSECELVTNAVKNAFPDIQVVAPNEPGLAVLKGAVIFGHSPEEISSRVVRFTYGVAVEGHFQKGYHPEEKRVQRGDEDFCRDLFSKFIEVNADAGVSDTIRKTYDIIDSSKPLEIAIYVSKKEYPLLVTEEGCTRLGEIIINAPLGGWRKNASVEVETGFGGTEFKVRAIEVQTQIQQEATFDFLS